MIAAIVRKVSGFSRSMAGHIFVLLTVGMALASILSLFIAEQSRQRDFDRIRLQRVVASTVDIAERLRHDPDRIESMLSNQLIMGASAAPDGISMTSPDPVLQDALADRLGPHANPEAGQVPAGFCFPRNRSNPRDKAAGLIGSPRPDCWMIRFSDPQGRRWSLAIYLPKIIAPPSAITNPLYLLLIVACSAGLSTIVARIAAKPLRRLETAAEAFSLSLDPEPIPEKGPEEVRAALSTFNLMQKRVRSGFRERTQLLAAISHDLQTPLTRLRLRLEQVQDEGLRERLLQDHMAMQTLVREGLDLASSAETQEEWSVLDIDSLLTSIAADAEEMGAQVRFLSGCGGTVRVKPNALMRCIGNLVDNAVRYGGSADLSSSRRNGRIFIMVQDHGPGIEEGMLDEMFEPFTRGTASQPGGRHGTGIGLTIVRSLAQTFEGSVRLSNAEGGGLLATIELKA